MLQCSNACFRAEHRIAPAVQQRQQPRRSVAVTGARTAQELHDSLDLRAMRLAAGQAQNTIPLLRGIAAATHARNIDGLSLAGDIITWIAY